MKDTSKKTFLSRFKSPIDNPIVGSVVAVASHPIIGLGLRGLAWAMTWSNPISLGVVVGAQAICIGLDTAREYRSSRLKEREKLIDHYGEMIARLDKVLEKLEKDPKERLLIRNRFNKAQENPEYEKQPRKGLEKGEWQYRAARVIEWGTALATDIVSIVASHGAHLATVLPKYLSMDVLPEILTTGSTSEYVGTYAKRKKALAENKELRAELIKKANDLNIPGYNKSTVQLGKYVEDLERNVRALETLSRSGEAYSNAKFDMCRADEESMPSTLKVESRRMALLKSLRGAVFGSKEDYKYIFDAVEWIGDKLGKAKNFIFGVKPESVVHQETAATQIKFDPKAIFDVPVHEPAKPTKRRSNSLDESKIKRMVNQADASTVLEESTPTKIRLRSKSL